MKTKDSTQRKHTNRLIGIVLSLAIVAFVCIIVAISTAENKKTVSIVKLKDNVSANALITDSMIKEDQMYYKEFAKSGVQKLSDGSTRQSIVTWDKRDKVVNNRYSAYYLRGDVPLYWDNTVKEQSKKNSYLYNMEGELLNIHLNTEDFGDMVVPGDSLNIRASYAETLYDLPSEEAYKLSAEAGSSGVEPIQTTVTEMPFNEVKVLDMLNSDGQSIFDIYYNFISKSKNEQTELLKDDSFIDSVKPSNILLEVTAEEADNFMKITAKSPTYLMTLLPRTSSSAILDSLNDIQQALSQKKEAGK